MIINKEITLPDKSLVAFNLLLLLYKNNDLIGKSLKTGKVYEHLADLMKLSAEQRTLKMEDGRCQWFNSVKYAKQMLIDNKLVVDPENGDWSVTEKGIEIIRSFEALSA